MQRFDRADLVPPPPPGGRVATQGVFDGVHLGHAAILAETVRQARARGAESLVLTFATHPRLLLSGAAPPSIGSVSERLERIAAFGVDVAVVVPFDAQLRDLAADVYLREFLGARLGVKALVLGDDARFGRAREGNAAYARTRGIPVTVVEAVLVGRTRASSGAVRAAIAEGRLDDAAALLGRRPTLRGEVVRGDGRARRLGFPTANLRLEHGLRPPHGVYAASIVLDGARRPAVVNIGIRPTFEGAGESVEAHVLGWSGDLYGRAVELELHTRLREERAFESPEALARQISLDIGETLTLLGGQPGAPDGPQRDLSPA